VLVQFVEIVLKKYIPSLYTALGIFLPLLTTNCALLGVTILNITKGYNFIESMVNSLGAGLGFLLALVIFSGIREYTENSDPPESFKGLPVTLISAAILSFSFFGFNGVMENLFSAR
jgi:electron transport complex protein RnfA